ncbi:hypothetical protein UPYG_G00192130 [Umbra pygmaea]|uniref:Uncharacterized protein n=1 Tax=Umbra pygmaea TaxID=75934 RepID=A0ABD0WT15_UMBPY
MMYIPPPGNLLGTCHLLPAGAEKLRVVSEAYGIYFFAIVNSYRSSYWRRILKHVQGTEEDSEEEEEDFRTKLAEWAVDKRITHKAFSQLLKILTKDHPVIPNTTQYLVFISKIMTFSVVLYQVEDFSSTCEGSRFVC